MTIASDPQSLIRIDAYDGEHAGALVQALVRVFDAEDVALDGDSRQVEIMTGGDPDAAVVRALDVVDSWLEANGLDSTVVHALGRKYRISADGAGR